ncbi:pre-rRNA processing [Didymosphaeria variabile]|uniref:Pre-rRNA processing n=1 Tax=Didymosphaeria variabile TaxID=1932322 RepID=A0A9W9C7S3_9PLEO|nr:pre-rRNA processing [Didymosphaeria variabile]KAJ4348536.1 pre-rRNA processing [Didymosphaeria variabile]
MAFEVSYNLENEQQFWDELDDIVSTRCQQHDHEIIDNALRSYLNVTTNYQSEYLQTEYSVAKCVYRLIQGELFTTHKAYVRRQIIYCLLQEDDNPTLHMVAAFLLFDGRNNQNDATFEMMHEEGVFARLIELIQLESVQEEPKLHQMLLDLLYESSRIQRLKWEDFVAIDDSFILYLLGVIEGVSDDHEDPYHYPVIRVLLVLNEQYLVASTQQQDGRITNRVIKALSTHGMTYKTFGCNLILLLNRESETSLQLLILKALYLIFGNPQTAEYFYTNDLHVLVDVILRNLIDLPSDSPAANALRHTYLRVLHPILTHSQISKPPHYKRNDIHQILNLLIASGNHFAPVDETTKRLVTRCTAVPWLKPPLITRTDTSETNGSDGALQSPVESAVGDGQKEFARRMLGMSVEGGEASSTSVLEVASHTEKPGVQTPSRGKEKDAA